MCPIYLKNKDPQAKNIVKKIIFNIYNYDNKDIYIY